MDESIQLLQRIVDPIAIDVLGVNSGATLDVTSADGSCTVTLTVHLGGHSRSADFVADDPYTLRDRMSAAARSACVQVKAAQGTTG